MSRVALAAQRQRRGQVDGGGGLPHAALLVGDCNDHQVMRIVATAVVNAVFDVTRNA